MLIAAALLVVALAGCEFFVFEPIPTAVSEGSISAPINLGVIPVSRSSQVDDSADSYYIVAVNPSTTYRVTMTGIDTLAGDLDLDIFSDALFSVRIGGSSSTTSTETADVTTGPSQTTLYIRAEVFGTGSGFFTLGVTLAP